LSIGLPLDNDGDGCDDDDDEIIMIATTRVIIILRAKSNKGRPMLKFYCEIKLIAIL
jgi:hypothetical protein